MKDVFYASLAGKRKDLVIKYLEKVSDRFIENEDRISISITKWYSKTTVSLFMSNDLVTLVIIRKCVAPFYEKYTVL